MGGRFGEILLILILLLLFFGPNKLPDMGRAIGKALGEFKKALGGEGNSPSQPQAPTQAVEATPAKKTRKSHSRRKK
jgi:TatA/E family protein of Tat protein translocase